MIPPFDKDGDLPPGIHQATWPEFQSRWCCGGVFDMITSREELRGAQGQIEELTEILDETKLRNRT